MSRTRINNQRTIMINRKKRMYRRIMIILWIAFFSFLAFLGSSVVTANAKMGKEEMRYKYYTTIYITRDMTLWDIAEEYATEEYRDKRVYVDEVMEINDLTNDKLSYGATICVPYYSDEYK